MQKLTSLALATAALALAGCGNAAPDNRAEGPANRVANQPPPPEQTRPPETEFGPEEIMAGTWTTRFEHSEFSGCWFEMAPDALAEFRRLYPPESPDAPQHGRSYRLQIIGRRSHFTQNGPNVFGHMGGWRCEIQATRIVSAAVIGGDRLPASVGADITRFDAEVERARKAAGQAPPAFSAGHDRARLEDQRRNMPPEAR